MPTAPNTSGKPRIGNEIGRGAEGIVYENLDQPDTVVKEFIQGLGSPFQARNEFQNLEKARAIHPVNVVKAQPPADPRQGWIVKEQVFLDVPSPTDQATLGPIAQDFIQAGVHDVGPNNFLFGHTAENATPRWLLIE